MNIGGSTGLEYFRPPLEQWPAGVPKSEARKIVVEGNTFIGSMSPVCFVGVDGATVRFNTIYKPGKWAFRILQETTEPGFEPELTFKDVSAPLEFAGLDEPSASSICHTMPVLTVRISDEEKALLAERAKKAGVTAGALVRRLLNEAPLTTADELIGEMSRRLGDSKLRVRRKK